MIQIQSYTHSFSYHTIFIHHMSHNSSYDYVQPVNMLKEQDPAIINTMISSHMEHHNQTRSSPTNAQQHGIDSRLLRQQRQKKSSKQPKQSSNQCYNPTKGPRQTHKTNVNPSTQQHIQLYGISQSSCCQSSPYCFGSSCCYQTPETRSTHSIQTYWT